MCRRGDIQARARQRRKALGDLLAAGNADGAFRAWLAWCATATDCGRFCENLVKGPGAAGVKCLDIRTGWAIDLYAALTDPDFKCPIGHF